MPWKFCILYGGREYDNLSIPHYELEDAIKYVEAFCAFHKDYTLSYLYKGGIKHFIEN